MIGMKSPPKVNWKLAIGIFLMVAVFIVAAQLSQQYSEPLRAVTTDTGWIGVLSYIGVMMASIVVAPLNTAFLLPVAATSFGPLLAALYSIIGWTIGSIIAFWLARYVKRLAFKDAALVVRVRAYEQKLPRLYWYGLIVALRMALPVDVVSYVLGAASSIGTRAFIVTTVIGIAPFAFMFTYASLGTVWIQIIVALLGISVFFWGVYFTKKKFF